MFIFNSEYCTNAFFSFPDFRSNVEEPGKMLEEKSGMYSV